MSRYYLPGLKIYVRAHPEIFRKIWEHDRITVYDIIGSAVIDSLQRIPVLISAMPILFEGYGFGVQVDWSDVDPKSFVAFHIQCSGDGKQWYDLSTRREYCYSYFHHLGNSVDSLQKYSRSLPSGRTYFYRVRAVYESGPGPWSNVLSATVMAYK